MITEVHIYGERIEHILQASACRHYISPARTAPNNLFIAVGHVYKRMYVAPLLLKYELRVFTRAKHNKQTKLL